MEGAGLLTHILAANMNIINRSSIRKNVLPTVWGRVESRDNGLLDGTRRRVVETDVSVDSEANTFEVLIIQIPGVHLKACWVVPDYRGESFSPLCRSLSSNC
jgi:hypothetical protein